MCVCLCLHVEGVPCTRKLPTQTHTRAWAPYESAQRRHCAWALVSADWASTDGYSPGSREALQQKQPESTPSHLSLLRGEAFGTESLVWLKDTSRVGGDSLVSGGDSLVSGGVNCGRDPGNPSSGIIQQQRN